MHDVGRVRGVGITKTRISPKRERRGDEKKRKSVRDRKKTKKKLTILIITFPVLFGVVRLLQVVVSKIVCKEYEQQDREYVPLYLCLLSPRPRSSAIFASFLAVLIGASWGRTPMSLGFLNVAIF